MYGWMRDFFLRLHLIFQWIFAFFFSFRCPLLHSTVTECHPKFLNCRSDFMWLCIICAVHFFFPVSLKINIQSQFCFLLFTYSFVIRIKFEFGAIFRYGLCSLHRLLLVCQINVCVYSLKCVSLSIFKCWTVILITF